MNSIIRNRHERAEAGFVKLSDRRTAAWILAVLVLIGLIMAAAQIWHRERSSAPSDERSVTRTIVDGVQSTIYRLDDQAGKQWYEIEIRVFEDRAFRMPVFFLNLQGEIITVDDAVARKAIHKWIKARAEATAASGSLAPSMGIDRPVLLLRVTS